MEPSRQVERLGRVPGLEGFGERLRRARAFPLRADRVEILQINVTRRCNLSCRHCHVEAGPHRSEVMSRELLVRCLEIATSAEEITTLDVTGGAPEMSPHLEWFLPRAAGLGKRLIVRSNLVILLERAYERFLDLYAAHGVELVGSLPDCRAEKANRQRGESSFERAVEALRLLNQRGYGIEGSGRVLEIVHNPAGAYLPAGQAALEREYRRRLQREQGVVFNRLLCITNMPVGRYLEYLLASGNFQEYLTELVTMYNPRAVHGVMCRSTLSVGWDGSLHDCDFNQMLGLDVLPPAPRHLDDFDLALLRHRTIFVHNHCYGCTAGSGSSCQGAIGS